MMFCELGSTNDFAGSLKFLANSWVVLMFFCFVLFVSTLAAAQGSTDLQVTVSGAGPIRGEHSLHPCLGS